MHKIDYEKLISIKRDVGWFEKKKEILFEGWPRLYTGVQKKGSKEDRQYVPSYEILMSRNIFC